MTENSTSDVAGPGNPDLVSARGDMVERPTERAQAKRLARDEGVDDKAHDERLVAGGKHVMTDVYTTIGVLVGFALVPLTGILRIDPAVAGLVALNILWSGWNILRGSVGALMDEIADPAALAEMRRVISSSAEGAIEAHDVRMRTVGNMTFVEFHLVVPARMVVEDAHEICDRIENAVREAVGQAIINIHIEPEFKAKASGVPVL